MDEDQNMRMIAMHIARDLAGGAAINLDINLDQPNPDAVIRSAAAIVAFIKDGVVPGEKADG